MKLSFVFLIITVMALMFATTSCSSPTIPSGPYTNLIWADEFNGTGIDTTIWKYETANTGWQNSWNNEYQDYVDNGSGGQNAFIAKESETDGTITSALVLRATRKNTANSMHSFESARLTTQGTKSWDHGRFEARMALPKGNGIWPALWMLGNTGGWPAGGEIDIMEMIGGTTGAQRGGGDDKVYTTCHWGKDPGHPSFGQSLQLSTGSGSQYHIYSLDWSANKMTASVDGIQYFTLDTWGSDKECFRKPFYLLVNLAVGGNWPGFPDATTTFPQDFKIDYIRVYQ